MTKTQPLHNSELYCIYQVIPQTFIATRVKFDLQNSYSKSHFCIDECIIEDSAREIRFTCILLGKVDVAEHPFKRYKVIKTHHELSGPLFPSGLRWVWCWRWQRNTNTQGLKRLSIEEATREHDPLYLVLIFKNRKMSRVREEMTHWERSQGKYSESNRS